MDLALIFTTIGTGAAVVGLIYSFLRNFRHDVDNRFQSFKTDMDNRFDRLDKRIDLMEQRNIETNKRMDGVYHILLRRTEKEI